MIGFLLKAMPFFENDGFFVEDDWLSWKGIDFHRKWLAVVKSNLIFVESVCFHWTWSVFPWSGVWPSPAIKPFSHWRWRTKVFIWPTSNKSMIRLACSFRLSNGSLFNLLSSVSVPRNCHKVLWAAMVCGKWAWMIVLLLINWTYFEND